MGLIWVLVSFPRIFLGNNRKVGKLCENRQVKFTKSRQNYPTYKNKCNLCSKKILQKFTSNPRVIEKFESRFFGQQLKQNF